MIRPPHYSGTKSGLIIEVLQYIQVNGAHSILQMVVFSSNHIYFGRFKSEMTLKILISENKTLNFLNVYIRSKFFFKITSMRSL